MSASVLLFSDRPSFASAWRPALEGFGLGVTVARPENLPERLEADGLINTAALVVDACSGGYDEDELLAHVGLSRALGVLAAVLLPGDDSMASVDELVDDLCAGLVARSDEDVQRVCAVLARRVHARRTRRFEYLTVSPGGRDLLAILADGSAVLLPRPAHASDDRSDIASIVLADDALHATIELTSGARFELTADGVVAKSGASNGANGAAHAPDLPGGGVDGVIDLSEIDGKRLGQRIRDLRLKAGLTQAELARRTGIHRPNIARVEAGRHTPSLETLARLAAAIGVPTTRVLTG